jgi:hypothetical protein
MYMFENITVAQLRKAVAIKEQIESLESELAGLLGASTSNGVRGRPSGRRTMSPAARARISAAQKARWAKTNEPAVSTTPKRGRRKMSAAVKARLSAAAKARWAKARAAGKKSL